MILLKFIALQIIKIQKSYKKQYKINNHKIIIMKRNIIIIMNKLSLFNYSIFNS